MNRQRLIAYRRVSTARQGVSGLGLEAQDAAVASYAKSVDASLLWAYADLAPIIAGMRADGLSLRQIAGWLNDEGHTTRQGKLWNPMQVQRVLEHRQPGLRILNPSTCLMASSPNLAHLRPNGL
jgi:Recombinase